MKRKLTAVIASVLSIILAFSCCFSASAYTVEDLKNDIKGTVQGVKDEVNDGTFWKASTVTDENGNVYSIFSGEGALTLVKGIKGIEDLVNVIWRYLNCIVTSILGVVGGKVIPQTDSSIKKLSDYESKNFYPGTEEFSDSEGSGWSLGYSQEILTPDDLMSKDYYMGGYNMFKVAKGKYDDMKVRTIVLSDGSGKGAVSFSVIDGIGFANYDVRQIRAIVADYAEENGLDFASINVGVTHSHSELDTQGIWASPLDWLNAIGSTMIEGLTPEGVDPELLARIHTLTAKSIIDAYEGMETGELYYAQLDGVKYFYDKVAPNIVIDEINRWRFVPDNAEVQPTLIANFGAHPETVGLVTDENPGNIISADYVAYTEQVVNSYGYNFMFIQGAIGSLISADRGPSWDGLSVSRVEGARRYGWELGYVLLGMSMTEQEIAATLDDGTDTEFIYKGRNESEDYTLWYEDWTPTTEAEVPAILNIALHEVIFEVDNPVLIGIGKFGLTSNLLLQDDNGACYTATEVGYLEIGDSVRVMMMPGETAPELIIGGKNMKAAGSQTGTDFMYEYLRSYFEGDGTELLVFDVMNDAVGYIHPDNDYGIGTLRFDEDIQKFTVNTNGMLSFGSKAASKFITEFMNIVDESTGEGIFTDIVR